MMSLSIFPSRIPASRVDARRVCATFARRSRNLLFRGSRLVLSDSRDEGSRAEPLHQFTSLSCQRHETGLLNVPDDLVATIRFPSPKRQECQRQLRECRRLFYCILHPGNCRPCTFYPNMRANIDSAVSLHNLAAMNTKQNCFFSFPECPPEQPLTGNKRE